tara:strand:- start:9845 stop:12913 length:3069 start_codon:yes stop_codon:yes gene_type:complete
MTQRKISQIILGAGRPYKGNQNTALKKVSSKTRVLDWIMQAAKYLNPEVHFVAGFQMNEIVSRYPNLHYTINSKWSSTGPVISLLETKVADNSQCIVSYGDILFREKTVKELINSDSDVSIAVDSRWKERYSTRTLEDINNSEKVVISGDEMTNAGSHISSDIANAEFIGLLTLKPKAMKFLQQNSESFKLNFSQANLTSLLEFLLKSGFVIKVVDVAGDWAELNEAHDLVNFILGTKAQSLQRLKDIISISKIAPQVSFTVSEWGNSSDKIIYNIIEKFKSKKIIVRSSAVSEDGFDSSNAGAYESILNIDTNDQKAVTNSIESVINSYPDKNLANQVLVQPMIENVSVSGVIFTRTLSESAPYYVVNFDDSSSETDTITSGSSSDHKTLVISRQDIDDISNHIPKAIFGLIPAIQEIENLLNFNALDIEFAIDANGQVHILQVRPLVSEKYEIDADNLIFESIASSIEKFKSLQNKSPFILGNSAIFGVMPDWNPAEIIGTKPLNLSFDLYRYLITDDVWATQRAEYGYRDVRPCPLLVSFSGHPYVDVRASFNSFIPANLEHQLAERLVDYYLKSLRENPQYHDKVEFEIVPTCYAFDFEDWRKKLSKSGFSDKEIDNLGEGLRNITKNAISRTQKDLQSVNIVKDRFDNIYSSDLPPLEKAFSLLEDCRRYGTLVFAHLARSAFVSITLLRTATAAGIISKSAMDSFLNSIETVAHEFINDAKKVADNKKSWSEFIDHYGHLRPGTYDITSESYKHNTEKFLSPVVEQSNLSEHNQGEKKNHWRSEKKSFENAVSNLGIVKEIHTIEIFLREAIEGREYAKFIFSRNLSAALDLISEYGKELGLNKLKMANISLGTLAAIRSGQITMEESLSRLIKDSDSCIQSHYKTNKIELPPLIISESDFKIFMYPNSQPNFVGSGRVSAEVATLSQAEISENASFLDDKILLIPAADPGFDWIFGHNISGLVTMYGGGNSHMAIRAKEFGLPAAIGVGEALYESLSSASIIQLDATNRKIEVIR